MRQLRFLGIAGSLRQASINRALLRAVGETLPEDASLTLYDRLGDLPPFNTDIAGEPEPVADFKQAIAGADALIFAVPEYNYSIPGVLKNAIDWASRPYGDSAWSGKPAAIMGASVGAGATMRAQYHLRQIFVYLDIHALNQPEVMIGNASSRFDASGNLTDDGTRERIRKLIEALVAWTRQLQGTAK